MLQAAVKPRRKGRAVTLRFQIRMPDGLFDRLLKKLHVPAIEGHELKEPSEIAPETQILARFFVFLKKTFPAETPEQPFFNNLLKADQTRAEGPQQIRPRDIGRFGGQRLRERCAACDLAVAPTPVNTGLREFGIRHHLGDPLARQGL